MKKAKHMDSFDKKISNLYDADQLSEQLPEGFGWEEMNGGIYEKMEKPKKKRKVFFWLFFIGSNLGLLAALLFFFSVKSKKPAGPVATTRTATVEKLEKLNPIISDQTPIEKIIVSTEKTLSNNKKVISTFKNKNTPTAISMVIPAKATNSTKTLAFLPVTKAVITSTKNAAAPVIIFSKDIFKEQLDLDETLGNAQNNKVEFVEKLTPHIYGGTLFTSGKYTQNQLRNQHSKWLPGYYTGLEFTVLAYKNWQLNLGYEHKFAIQLFDFQNITDTIANGVAEVLTSITTNSLNGSVSEIREEIATQAVRTRNYLNYNTFRSHALRMTILRNFELSEKLSLTAGFGGSYNFLNRTQGRTIGQDKNKLDYGQENQIYRKHNFGLEGGLSLAYQIGAFSLRGNFWIEKSLEYSMEPTENIRPVFYKIGLGVTRSF